MEEIRKAINMIKKVIFVLFGVVIIWFGIGYAKDTIHFREVAVETTAIVSKSERYRESNGDILYDTYITYQANGKKQEEELGKFSSQMEKGETITIYYNPDYPNEFRRERNSRAGYVIVLVGVAVAAVGIFSSGEALNVSMKKYK